MTTWKMYTGRDDPISHVNNFEIQMDLQGVRDDVHCRIFPATLSDIAQQWFFQLEPGTITFWDTFVRLFYSQFFVACIPPAKLIDLVDIKQGPNEPLKDYVLRFIQEVARSRTVSDEGKLMAIMAGIQIKGPLWTELRRKTVYSTRKFLDRADEFIRLEEVIRRADQANQAGSTTALPAKDNGSPNQNKNQTTNGNGNGNNNGQRSGKQNNNSNSGNNKDKKGPKPMISHESKIISLPLTLCSWGHDKKSFKLHKLRYHIGNLIP
ncbi:uncharacterized protein LOC133806771 [Humulus lupulus]|uniref:uncharacterized protein LOC133806771 n=1 Tax=Humulus lupulus TaxID=3486 RepID=UPI002B412BD0|nr:uncharacterized protein LOC133806771 [Humulus lupulus]